MSIAKNKVCVKRRQLFHADSFHLCEMAVEAGSREAKWTERKQEQ